MKLKLLFLASVVAAMTLALVGAMKDLGSTHAAAPLPVQPFNPQALGGLSTTRLGHKVDTNWSVSQNPEGHRSGGGIGFTGPGFNVDLDKNMANGSNIGTVSASMDVNCDGGIDYLYDDCRNQTPLMFKEAATTVVNTPDDYLIPIMPPYTWLARHEATLTHVCIGTTGAQAGVNSVLNTVYATVPFSPSGESGVAFTMLGGQPGGPPSPICMDAPAGSIGTTSIVNNPKLQGDIDGPCDPDVNECADAGIYGMWTSNIVSIASVPGSTTIPVEKHKVNNGPEGGTFKELWEVESTNSNIAAEWIPVGTPVGPTYTETVPLNKGVDYAQSTNLSISCNAPGNYWGLVVLKNILAPVLPTEDTFLDDNASMFTVLVKCGSPATTPEVDKQVGVIKTSGPDHVAIASGGTAPVTIDVVTVNNSASSALGDEWLVAEAVDTDATAGPDVTFSWNSTVTVDSGTNGGQGSVTPGTTACGTGCIKFQVNEWVGQADVNATLNVTCPSTTATGLYPLVVKAIDAPAAGAGFESKPGDNAQYKVITVRCGGAAPDGKEDGAGLYTTWGANSSDPDIRKPYKSPPSFPSDTRYIERTVTTQCYWEDADGCFTDAAGTVPCDSVAGGGNNNGYIEPSESWNDYELKQICNQHGCGIDAIDSDRDCLMDAAYAQPGHPVDPIPDPTGNLCDVVPYSENPVVVQYDIATDQDCDGLPDGIERAWGSNPLLPDSDNDGAKDFVEVFQWTNPLNPDTDNDGFKDQPANVYRDNTDPSMDNCPSVPNPDQVNTDGHPRNAGPNMPGSTIASNPNADKKGDACDLDNDNDNALDIYELEKGTNPFDIDSDGDTVQDGTELRIQIADPMSANALNPNIFPTWSILEQTYYRGCHINVPTSGPFGKTGGVENDPDGDGINCPTDIDSDNGTGTGAAAKAEVIDSVEAFGYNTLIADKDTDGDGCDDWVEIHDINGDRTADSGDQLALNRRVARKIAANPITDRVFDTNKDTYIDSGDQLSLNLNTCTLKRNTGGCPMCPPEN